MYFQINKFKALENVRVDVPCEIRGGNGTGKTTYLHAISFAISGKKVNGKEFEELYDNRVDLHNAIADVTFFDDYGNSFQRIVKPIFQTSRAGIESVKILRSTECRENTIVVNDYAPKFADFFKLGTDYFFNQNQDVQRGIFLDVFKSKLPNFDIKAAQLKKKELKRANDADIAIIKEKQDFIKNTKDVDVPGIDSELSAKNEEYLKLRNSIDENAISEINKRNNEAMKFYFDKKSSLNSELLQCESTIKICKNSISEKEARLVDVKNSTFTPTTPTNIDSLSKEVEALIEKLESIHFYETVEEYAKVYSDKNPVLIENRKRISEIAAREFDESINLSSGCPISGEFCEVAKNNAVKSARAAFDTKKNAEIDAIKSENRSILTKEWSDAKNSYLIVKSELDTKTYARNKAEAANEYVESENVKNGIDFKNSKIELIAKLEGEVTTLKIELEKLEQKERLCKLDIETLAEPVPEKLPESVQISDELKEAHTEYERVKEDAIKAQGVNENNAKNREAAAQTIKEKQASLIPIIEQSLKLQNEITDYFSNLDGVIAQEFEGDIKIGVQLQEYIMSRDEYDDCFKITANGKVYPYELNGALQNNAKLQILQGIQNVVGYKGVTVIDNCEANTTQPLNTLNLNCVSAFATTDKELTFTKK